MSNQPKALQLAAMAHLGYRVGWQREAAVELRRLHALNAELLEALKKIAAIEDQMYGPDWEEIEEARDIASAAIAKAEGKV
jgi:hypothetical protein